MNEADILVGRAKSELWIYLNLKKGKLKDPRRLGQDVSNIGHWGIGDYAIRLKDSRDLKYAMGLIKQAYAHN